VTISLAEKGLTHERRLVDLQDKPADFEAVYQHACADVNARAKVPILEVDESTALVESLVICDYLEELAPRANENAVERALARLWVSRFSDNLPYVAVLKTDEGSDEEAAALAKLREGMRALDGFLREHGRHNGPFLLDDFSLAETCTAPFAQRFVVCMPGLRPSLGEPYDMLEAEGCERLAAWMRSVCERPSCVVSLPPPDDLVSSYAKLLERMRAMAAK